MPTFSKEHDGSFSASTMKAMVDEMYRLTDEYSIETYPAEHRKHLGASIIGDACSRKLWYSFRWAKLEQFEPRMRRLFGRGHKEEANFIEILSWMGFFVREIDPLTDKQYRFTNHNGHFGGSGDSVMLLPWFRDKNDPRILAEYKTHNLKSFNKLKDKGLKISKPQHWSQMCCYGLAFQVRYGIYVAICKDTDEIYYDMFELDWQYAKQLNNKAGDIIYSQLPLPRISNNPLWFDCKFCDKADICHHGAPVEKNCRSCKQAIPVEDGKWKCTRFDDTIPDDFIKEGCEFHVSINIA